MIERLEDFTKSKDVTDILKNQLTMQRGILFNPRAVMHPLGHIHDTLFVIYCCLSFLSCNPWLCLNNEHVIKVVCTDASSPKTRDTEGLLASYTGELTNQILTSLHR